MRITLPLHLSALLVALDLTWKAHDREKKTMICTITYTHTQTAHRWRARAHTYHKPRTQPYDARAHTPRARAFSPIPPDPKTKPGRKSPSEVHPAHAHHHDLTAQTVHARAERRITSNNNNNRDKPNGRRLFGLGVHDAPDDLPNPALEALLVEHAALVKELCELALLARAALPEQRLPARRGAHVCEPERVPGWRGGGGGRRLCGDGYPLGDDLRRGKR